MANIQAQTKKRTAAQPAMALRLSTRKGFFPKVIFLFFFFAYHDGRMPDVHRGLKAVGTGMGTFLKDFCGLSQPQRCYIRRSSSILIVRGSISPISPSRDGVQIFLDMPLAAG
jgi:hypothetical protein